MKIAKSQFHNDGFTLVETLVAIVIVSTVFASIWSWFGTATITTNRITRAVELPFIIDQFLENLEYQPLEKISQGTFNFDSFRIEWRSNIARQSSQEFFIRQEKWNSGLFNIEFTIYQNKDLIFQSSTKQYRYWKNPNYVPKPPF